MTLHIAYLLVFLLGAVAAQQPSPIDNSLQGEPEIECNTDAILVNFNLKNNFEGHVFVKGHYNEPGCRTDATNSHAATISVPFNACGMRRERSANPPGLFIGATVIISFHPQFLTRVDKAYNVKCFYTEADKTVASNLNVSALTTEVISASIQLPACKYEVLTQANGTKVTYAKIGDRVYHQWSCDGDPKLFCMTVHSCFVEDGLGQKVQLLDENGCAMDKYLLGNIDYSEDLKGGNESHVFKFADQPSVFFNCQIRISLKEDNKCKRSSDICPAPIKGRKREAGFGDSSSESVSSDSDYKQDGHELDVYSPSIIVLEDPVQFADHESKDQRVQKYSAQLQRSSAGSVCFTATSLGLLITGAAIVLIISIGFLAIACIRFHHSKARRL